jgi:hypothetical protein
MKKIRTGSATRLADRDRECRFCFLELIPTDPSLEPDLVPKTLSGSIHMLDEPLGPFPNARNQPLREQGREGVCGHQLAEP